MSPTRSIAKERVRTTIFIADDDDAFRTILRDELIGHGYDVIEAADGVQALELLAMAADGHGEPPDVVVLDVCMPGYSGLGVLKVMRRFKKRPPTLLITGFTHQSVDVLAERFGAARVFHKPIDLDQVLDAVRDAAMHGASP